MRKKYCWLAGGWNLVLERCEKKILLGWRLLELPNRVFISLEKDETNEYLEKTVCVNISLYTVFALASMFIWSKIKSYVNAKGYFFLCT